MEKERFDTLLSAAILNQEENSSRSFNKDKVWRNSLGRNRKNLITAISMAATILIIMNFITADNTNDTSGSEQPKEIKIADLDKGVPDKSGSPKSIIPSFKPTKSERTSTKKEEGILADRDVVIIQSIKTDAVKIANQQIVEITRPVLPSNLTPVFEDIKITFRRGRAVQGQESDARITFTKGSKRGSSTKDSTDLTYYVTRSFPFKLQLKQSQ